MSFLKLLLVALAVASVVADSEVVCRLESCPRCRLSRLPKVKDFIWNHAPSYDESVFHVKYTSGDPRLVCERNGEEYYRETVVGSDAADIIAKLAVHGVHPRPKGDEL